MSPLYSPPPEKPSRYCAKCQETWPNLAGFTSCPVCDIPTTAHTDEHGFTSGPAAMATALRRKQSNEAHEEFERYYQRLLNQNTATDLKDLSELELIEIVEAFINGS